MPDGEKEMSIVDRMFQLSADGSTVDQIVELVNEETVGPNAALCWDARKVSRLLRLHSLSAGEPSVPETETKLATAVYVRGVTSGQDAAASLEVQEAACVDLAESLGYQVEDAGVHQDVGSGGGADA